MPHRLLPVLIFGAALAVAGCSKSASSDSSAAPAETSLVADSTVPADTAAAADTASSVTDSTPPAADSSAVASGSTSTSTTGTGVLSELQNGDRACYVVLKTDAGEVTLPGDFTLCPGDTSDATPLIGQAVRYRTEKGKIAAASCEGNPDCAESDEVDLVVQIDAASPGAGASAEISVAK